MSIATDCGVTDEFPMMRSAGPVLAVLSAFLAFSLQPLAAYSSERGNLPQQTRQRLLEHVEARIRILEAAQECLRAAADMQDAAACHETERQKAKALRNRDRAKLKEGDPSPSRGESSRDMAPR